jgi:protein SCO1
MTRPIPPDSWRFLTGDKQNIDRLADSVGFHFQRLETGFNHPTTLIILGSDGKISRYIRGIVYTPSDVEMALREAAKGEIGATRPGASMSRSLMALCFYYKSETGTYVPSITRIAGLAILLCVAIFTVVFLIRRTKRNPQQS